MTNWRRVEQNGKVGYVRGSEKPLMVPSVEACRERLVKVLEEAGGDITQQSVKDFWIDQASKLFNEDEMTTAWANEKYERLSRVWEELTVPPEQPDFFEGVEE